MALVLPRGEVRALRGRPEQLTVAAGFLPHAQAHDHGVGIGLDRALQIRIVARRADLQYASLGTDGAVVLGVKTMPVILKIPAVQFFSLVLGASFCLVHLRKSYPLDDVEALNTTFVNSADDPSFLAFLRRIKLKEFRKLVAQWRRWGF